MPETRKFEGNTGDPIGDAIREAMGVQPGCGPNGCPPRKPKATPVVDTIGTFTFKADPVRKPVDDEDDLD